MKGKAEEFPLEELEGVEINIRERFTKKKGIKKSEDTIIIDDPIPLSGEQFMYRDKFLEIYKKFFK